MIRCCELERLKILHGGPKRDEKAGSEIEEALTSRRRRLVAHARRD